MGAYMRMDYYDGFTDYVNFGACWEDGNCWGAWLKYENGNYYSTEISFHFDGEFSDQLPQIPSDPSVQYYEWNSNYMYSYYDLQFNYIWYYMEYGTVFSRWMPNRD